MWLQRYRNSRLVGCVMAALLVGLFLWAASSPLPFTPLSDGDVEDFSFIVYGDIQDNYKNGHQALVNLMLKEDAAFVVNTGDISSNGGKDYQRNFYPIIQELAKRMAFFPSLGNHDVNWGSPLSRNRFLTFFHQTFDYLGQQENNAHLLEPATQKTWYSFQYGNALFIVLDSNLFIDEGQYRRTHRFASYRNYLQEQLIWVRDLLKDSSGNPQIRAKFVFFHHSPIVSDEKDPVPFFGWGGHPGHSRMVVNQTVPSEEPGERQYLLDLFRQHRVTAVFTGHEHYYERWQEIIREDNRPIHLLNWVVTGQGGVKPRGTPKYKEEQISKLLEENEAYRQYLTRSSQLNPKWTAELRHPFPTEENRSGSFHSYVLVTVNSSGVRFQTKDISGKVRDQGDFSPVGSLVADLDSD